MFLTAQEYLSHCYTSPKFFPTLPLPNEDFIKLWQENFGADSLSFLNKNFGLDVENFTWQNVSAVKISFVQTFGGKLPVIDTASHSDFLSMEALLNGKNSCGNYPLTVNAFTISAKNKKIFKHRLILLNRAPYSNIPAEKLNLREEEWLEISHKLRLRHESAHYETLRILGGMKNHALDEILADALGQIAAFGNFSPARQRLFFGLHGNKCDGRLNIYCQKIIPAEREIVYASVDKVLDAVEKINALENFTEQFSFITGNSILDILKREAAAL
ncbi:MAG: hypothetical protein IJT73_03920 [Selenomonadaceae bacterium]|nr:hypothetical protein [Selenomonadaceae bacterium]